jgi:hypothetical protein
MEEITLDSMDIKPSSDFGGGIEFLLNDAKPTAGVSFAEDMKEFEDMGKSLKFENTASPIHLARETVSMDTQRQTTSDGYRHIQEINVEGELKNIEIKSKEEMLKEKFQYLRKLETLQQKGVELTKHYTMESSLDEMKGEYEYQQSERERKNSVQFQGKMLTTLITGIEFLNSKFDPFDIKLDGISENIQENINDYDDIFSELAEKYRSKAKMAPELKLIFQLASAGIMVHMSNTMFKSAIPGMDDIMRQNPDLMNQFTRAAASTMEKTSPGVNQFVQQFTKPEPRRDKRPEMNGPENINSILTGLKKTIPLPDKNDSMISLEELDNLGDTPVTSRRGRRKSDKNSIHIAI